MSEPSGLRAHRRMRLGAIPLPALGALAVLAALLVVPVAPLGFFGHAPSAGTPAAIGSAPTTHSLGARSALTPAWLPTNGRVPFGPGVAHPALGATGPVGVEPLAGPSTSSNFALTNSDCATFGLLPPSYPTGFSTSSIVAVGGSNSTLVAIGGSMAGLFNASLPTGSSCSISNYNPSGFFLSHGTTVLWRSTDAGHTWTDMYVRQNKTHWLNAADPSNGSFSWGNGAIASTSSGTLVAAMEYVPSCFLNVTGCTNTTIAGDWGVAVTRSTDGGVSWSVPTQVFGAQGIKYLTGWGSACGGTAADGFYYYDLVEHPSIEINPSNNVAIVSWDQFDFNADPATCSQAPSAQVNVSISLDAGKTFGTPKAISNTVSDSVELALGPDQSVTALYADFSASSAAGSWTWGSERTTNNGTTWNAEHDIGTSLVNGIQLSSFTLSYNAFSEPQIGVDSWSSSPYSGHEYIAWSDNQTGSNAGYPGIDFIASADRGATWGSAVTLTPSSHAIVYFEPAVAVDSAGVVYVTYYGLTVNTGAYNLYGVVSPDGGATWGSQTLITDSAGTPGGAVQDLGTMTGSVGTSNGAYPIWVDCRAAACSSSGDTQTWDANIHAVTISSNVPSVSATVTTFGASSSVTLPDWQAWDNASSHTVAVPQYVTDTSNASAVWGFQGWSGLSSSTSFSTTVSFGANSPTTLTANYVEVPAAVLQGTFAPAGSGASLTLNGVAIPLTVLNPTTLQYSKSVASGLTYTLVASETLYQSQTVTVPTSSGGSYWTNFTLLRETGTLSGTVAVTTGTPADAAVTVNDTAVTGVNPTTGFFSLSLAWGWYWVNASGATPGGLTAFSEYLEVLPGATTPVSITLSGGWINGTTTYHSGLVMKIDDSIPVAVTTFGTFNAPVLGGVHSLVTTAPGYNLSVIKGINVVPGLGAIVNVNLTNKGWISGVITTTAALAPSAGLKVHIYNVSTGSGNFAPVAADGSFNYSVQGGLTYTVNVSATGYSSFQRLATITAGNGSSFSISLNKTQSTGCTVNCNPGGNNNNGSTSSSGLSNTDLILIVVVILLVAVVLAVVLMRRGGGGGRSDDMGDSGSAAPYDESNEPMGSPPPPPPGAA